MHYFAYSNLLDVDYMRRFCPTAEPVGVMRLDGYELRYRMSDEDMTRLDEASGVPNGDWARKQVTVHDRDGKAVETTTYVIPQPSGAHSPPDSYVAPMFKGAADFGLPESYVARLHGLVDAAKSVS
jgi:hypothetical protein